MATWKRDFASGLIVLVPLIVTFWVLLWLFNRIADATVLDVAGVLEEFGYEQAATLVEVLLTIVVFVLIVLAVGYLMRTAVGSVLENMIDRMMNQLPGLRVIYNASKMAAETALTGTDSLQTPVKVEPWEGMRMTAFKTGKQTEDGREMLFMPTAPNITTGFVIEVEDEDITETDERVEEALTRLLSAGFGDNKDNEVQIGAITDDTTGPEELPSPPKQDGREQQQAAGDE